MAIIMVQARVRNSCLIPILHTTVISYAKGLSSYTGPFVPSDRISAISFSDKNNNQSDLDPCLNLCGSIINNASLSKLGRNEPQESLVSAQCDLVRIGCILIVSNS
jgi:hypothetical protein